MRVDGLESAKAAVRAQIAFCGSTPAYKVVLDRVALNAPYAADPDLWQQIAQELRR